MSASLPNVSAAPTHAPGAGPAHAGAAAKGPLADFEAILATMFNLKDTHDAAAPDAAPTDATKADAAALAAAAAAGSPAATLKAIAAAAAATAAAALQKDGKTAKAGKTDAVAATGEPKKDDKATADADAAAAAALLAGGVTQPTPVPTALAQAAAAAAATPTAATPVEVKAGQPTPAAATTAPALPAQTPATPTVVDPHAASAAADAAAALFAGPQPQGQAEATSPAATTPDGGAKPALQTLAVPAAGEPHPALDSQATAQAASPPPSLAAPVAQAQAQAQAQTQAQTQPPIQPDAAQATLPAEALAAQLQPQPAFREKPVVRTPRIDAAAPGAGAASAAAAPHAAHPGVSETLEIAANLTAARGDTHPEVETALGDGPEADTTIITPERSVEGAAPTPLAAANAPITQALAAAVRGSPETVAHLAAQILKKLDGRTTQFDVELDPAGLGKVDVRVNIAADGRVTAGMSFDNPQAAADLKARSGELQHALEQAGFDVSGGMTFDVAGDQGRPGQGAQGQDAGATFRGRAFQAALATAGDAIDTAVGGAFNLRQSARSGVDIRI